MIGSALITFTVGSDDAPVAERPEAHTVVIPQLVRWSRVDEEGDTDVVLHFRDGTHLKFLRVQRDKARELEGVLTKSVEDYYGGRR